MSLLPRSLLARSFLLIATVLVLSTAAWYMIFRTYEREPQVHQVARMVVSVVNLVRSAIVAAQPGKRTELLIELEELEGIRIYPKDAAQKVQPTERNPLLDSVEAAIRLQLGSGTAFAQEVDGDEGFWVSFVIEDDEYWVMLPSDRLPQDRTLQWLGWGLLALLLALAAAYIVVSRITQPLRMLSRAAAEIGQGRRPSIVAEAGPEELQGVMRAFNQMSRDLARLDEDRALILAGVSHDLRTPLARMRLAIEMTDADAELKHGMNADIDDMDRIIGQFLDFARAETGEKLQNIDLRALAEELARTYRERGRELSTDLQPTPDVALRPMATRRMLTNLLDNAYRYAEHGIALHTRFEQGAVIVEVCDRGPGIPADQVERLKQPFQRMETARSGKGGSGLGLAIVDRIARMHQGRFDLLARDGGGLIARITLPARG